MSGGVLAPVAIVGAAAAGVGIAIGAAAVAAGTIVTMGSIAAYEQIRLARECTVAVREAKNARVCAIRTYQRDSDNAYNRILAATHSEILRLKTELEKKGHRIDLPALGRTEDEILLRLITLSLSGTCSPKARVLRTPAEIVKSICCLIDPLFVYIPASDAVFRELTQIKQAAVALASSSDIPIADRTHRLLDTESALLVRMEDFRRLSKKYEYYLAQFTALTYANKMLAQACGETVIERRYSAQNAEAQIRELQTANAELSKKLRTIMRNDPSFVNANRKLASLVEKAVNESGCKKISSAEKDFGFVSMYEYRSSLLRVIVSRDGMLSLDLVGKDGESKRQIKADERVFCSEGLADIYRAFERNGLITQTESIRNLTDDSILYEGDLEEYESQRNAEEEAGPRHMYADGTGGAEA